MVIMKMTDDFSETAQSHSNERQHSFDHANICSKSLIIRNVYMQYCLH